jgi:hypothetical protein
MRIQIKSSSIGDVVSLIADLKTNILINTIQGNWIMVITDDISLRSVDVNSADLLIVGQGVQLPKYLKSKVLFADNIGYVKEGSEYFLIIE